MTNPDLKSMGYHTYNHVGSLAASLAVNNAASSDDNQPAEPPPQDEFPATQIAKHGLVRLVDHMGGDAAIVQAARVSYGAGTKSVREDEALIRYLMRHGHTSPFEMVVLKFHIKCPIFVARQIVRHRTASMNEMSGRYSEMPEEYYVPTYFHKQATKNKQGSSSEVVVHDGYGISVAETASALMESAFMDYRYLLEAGVSREEARIVLPLSTYTEFYWQMNLRNLFHFLQLRLDEHAQAETRQYAKAIAWYTMRVAPVAYKAFEDFVLNSVRFSEREMLYIRAAAAGSNPVWVGDGMSPGEQEEFWAKLNFPFNGGLKEEAA